VQILVQLYYARTHNNILFIGTAEGRGQDNDVLLAGCDKEVAFVVQSGPVYLIGSHRDTSSRPLGDPFIWAFWAIIVVGPEPGTIF